MLPKRVRGPGDTPTESSTLFISSFLYETSSSLNRCLQGVEQ